jgi:hypothetical protein
MDDQRFDRLTRSMAGGLSRRRVLKALAGSIAGVAGVGIRRHAGVASAQPVPTVICNPAVAGNSVCFSAALKIFGTNNPCVTAASCTGPIVDQFGRRECVFHFAAAGAPCSDGNACTQGDACDGAGHCQPGLPVTCDDDACTTGRCDPAIGCVQTPITCDAPDACHTADTCDPSTGCVFTETDCSHLDGPCTVGVCNPTTGACESQPGHVGAPCDGGDACTQHTTCQPDGSCGGGQAVTCPVPDVCHAAGMCDPATGCSQPTLAVGTCKSGRIKDGPCDCDGTCCAAGDNCVDEPGRRRCKKQDATANAKRK